MATAAWMVHQSHIFYMVLQTRVKEKEEGMPSFLALRRFQIKKVSH